MIDSFTKNAWVKPLTNKKTKTNLHGFMERILNVNQINSDLIQEENLSINLCKNG